MSDIAALHRDLQDSWNDMLHRWYESTEIWQGTNRDSFSDRCMQEMEILMKECLNALAEMEDAVNSAEVTLKNTR